MWHVVNCFQNSVSLIPTTTMLTIVLHIHSCELLSEFSIFDTNNNHSVHHRFRGIVVNCFQNSVSLIPTTTIHLHKHQTLSCELLSEFSIFDTNNNKEINEAQRSAVVNCFQNSVSLIPTTTFLHVLLANDRLWIAFRIQYLWYQQQLWLTTWYIAFRCELLSEFSIFDTNNNWPVIYLDRLQVVNCFQNSVSLIPTTTL